MARKEAENLRQSNRAMGHGTEIDLRNMQKNGRKGNKGKEYIMSHTPIVPKSKWRVEIDGRILAAGIIMIWFIGYIIGH